MIKLRILPMLLTLLFGVFHLFCSHAVFCSI